MWWSDLLRLCCIRFQASRIWSNAVPVSRKIPFDYGHTLSTSMCLRCNPVSSQLNVNQAMSPDRLDQGTRNHGVYPLDNRSEEHTASFFSFRWDWVKGSLQWFTKKNLKWFPALAMESRRGGKISRPHCRDFSRSIPTSRVSPFSETLVQLWSSSPFFSASHDLSGFERAERNR